MVLMVLELILVFLGLILVVLEVVRGDLGLLDLGVQCRR